MGTVRRTKSAQSVVSMFVNVYATYRVWIKPFTFVPRLRWTKKMERATTKTVLAPSMRTPPILQLCWTQPAFSVRPREVATLCSISDVLPRLGGLVTPLINSFSFSYTTHRAFFEVFRFSLCFQLTGRGTMAVLRRPPPASSPQLEALTASRLIPPCPSGCCPRHRAAVFLPTRRRLTRRQGSTTTPTRTPSPWLPVKLPALEYQQPVSSQK